MPDTTYDIPAQAMQYRSDYYRTELVTDYLAKGRPYPIYKILGGVNITPDDQSAIKLLWTRSGGYLSVSGSIATGLTATSDGQEVDADFTVLLDGKELSVTVNVPAHLAIGIQVDSQNTIQFDLSKTPLLVTFNDQLTQDGYPVDTPQQQNFVAAAWSAQQIDYELDSGFIIRLLLTQSPTHALFLSALASDGPCPGGGSSGGGSGQTGGKSAPQTQKICAGTLIPTGWVIVDDDWNPTDCGNPTDIVMNEVTILNAADTNAFGVGDLLWVCAGSPIPDGWIATTQSQWLPTACGHPVEIVQNVIQIKRIK